MAQNELSFKVLKEFIERNYLKNRTLVSKDIPEIFDDIERISGLSVVRHKFHSGQEFGTWIIPPRWDVKEAWLKDASGKVLTSYKDHPMFVCPYSKAVHLILTKKELLAHVSTDPKQPDAYIYNWRYAYDYRLRLKDWGISLPQKIIKKLDSDRFELFIDTEVEEGDMLVGEIILKGESEKSLLFLANYCHPGQVNDSFSGLAMFIKVMHTLSQRKRRYYTYRFLFMPETIGSAVFIAKDPARLENVFGTIFSEMVGYGQDWYIKQTSQANTYMDLMASDCRRIFGDVKSSPFWGIYSNDELIFNSVQVGIPSLSVQKYPFQEYHTSNDIPSKLIPENIQYANDMILYMIDVLERDGVYRFTTDVPFWMTRFDLSFDNINEKEEEFSFKFDIVYRYLDGKRSLLEISNILNVPFEKVFSFIQTLHRYGLVFQSYTCPLRLFEFKTNLRKP